MKECEREESMVNDNKMISGENSNRLSVRFKNQIKQMSAFAKIKVAIRIVVICMAIVVAVISRLPSRQQVDMLSLSGAETGQDSGAITKENAVIQKFSFKETVQLKDVRIKCAQEFATTGKDCSVIVVGLKDEDGDILWKKRVKSSRFEPGKRVRITFDHGVQAKQDKAYYLYFKCPKENNASNIIFAMTAKATPSSQIKLGKTKIASQCLDMKYHYQTSDREAMKLLFIVALLCIVVMGLPGWFIRKIGSITGIRYAIFFTNPIVLWQLVTMFYQQQGMYTKAVNQFSVILLLAIQLLVFAAIWNTWICMIVTDSAAFLLAMTNLQVTQFKGVPLIPSDFLFIRTAMDVKGSYAITWTHWQMVCIAAMIVYLCLLGRMMQIALLKYRKQHYKTKVKKKRAFLIVKWSCFTVCHIVLLIVGIYTIKELYNGPQLAQNQIAVDIWNRKSSVKTNGFYLDFFMNFHYLSMQKPADYSKNEVAKLVKDGVAEYENAHLSDDVSKTEFPSKPNIIIIMNESLADYSLLTQGGNMPLSEDPLPFIHSLNDNVQKGKCYVSVFGSMTPNSEFECLTGNSMAFFPVNTVPYQQFISGRTFGLVDHLNKLGYRTLAMHPCTGTNWNRYNTYKSMEFDDFYSINQFKNATKLRGKITDQATYDKIISEFEKKDDKPLFIMDVTMQNHGGYDSGTVFEHPIQADAGQYPLANEYLSCAWESDQAYKNLIIYFQDYKEPTIILMFGDHQPNVDPEFVARVLGDNGTGLDLQAAEEKYCTPYILWANYKLDTKLDGVTSTNYLSNLVLNNAGLPLSKYNACIENVQQQIQAINAYGFRTYDGVWHSLDENGEYKNMIQQYNILEYGYFSDTDEEKMKKIFDVKE